MASSYTFFAHRLSHRHVDFEASHGPGSSRIEVVARDGDVLSETGRRRCTYSDRKHRWRRRCEVVSSPQIRPTTPPPNQFRKLLTPTFRILSTSLPSSAPLLQTPQNVTRGFWPSFSPPPDAGRTLPVSQQDFETENPQRRTTYSPQVKKLPLLPLKPRHSLGTPEGDEAQGSPEQSGPRSEQKNSSLSSFSENFAFDRDFAFQAGESVPKTPSEAVTSSTGNIVRHQAVISSPNGISLNSSDQSRRISVFSFSSQYSQSFAASLIRLERTILRYERAILEILSAHTSLELSRAISSEGTPKSQLQAIQAILDTEELVTNEMSNPFRSSSGKTTPKKSRTTPPRAIFSDLPEAHSAITGATAARGDKFPSPTPGMPLTENPYAKLPPTIDLPDSPAKHTGGPADEEVKARVARSDFPKVDGPERPETPLLPPTPIRVRPERRETPSLGIAQLFKQPSPGRDGSSSGVGKESYELDVLNRDGRHGKSALDEQDCDMESPKSLSSFGLESPSKSKVHRDAGRDPSRRRRVDTDVHQSSTLSNIICRYNDDSDVIRIRKGSQRSIEVSTFHEVSSLPAGDEGEILYQDSTAGHTPPLKHLMLAFTAPERSTSGQPPRGPLPALPTLPTLPAPFACQAFEDTQDASGSEPTDYANTRELLNIASEPEERHRTRAVDPAPYHDGRGRALNSAGRPRHQKTLLNSQLFDPGRNEISDQKGEIIGRSASGGPPYIGIEHAIGASDGSAGSAEVFLRPLAYTPSPESNPFAALERRSPLASAVDQEDEEGEEDGEPVHLRRRPQMITGPDMTNLRQRLYPGGPQSSSSQGLSADSSSGQGRTASGRFQHDETLASLNGGLPTRSLRDMESLIKHVGAIFGQEEEDERAIVGDDVAGDQHEEEGDDGDWETVHESGLRTRAPRKSMANREETATSLANMSSYGSLTGSVPAIPWGPLTSRGRVLSHPPEAGTPYRNQLRTDTVTGQSTMSPEYETSDEPRGYGEYEMTGKYHAQGLGRSFPAFAATNQSSNIPQERFQTTYHHPNPMPMKHKHPFSETPPTIEPTDESRADSLIYPSSTSDKVGYLGSAEVDGDPEEETTQSGLVTSKKRNTQQLSASAAAGKGQLNMRETRELSRPSNLSVDGSYSESLNSNPALSTSSIIHDSQYLPRASGTFSKTTILGPKGNITGSFDGTGMRAVGSSEADNSNDSALMRSHKYERLDDERSPYPAGPSTIKIPTPQSTPKTPKKVKFAENVQTEMAVPVSAAVVPTKNGLSISKPQEFMIPTTLPKRNSYAISKLNVAKSLDRENGLKYTPRLFNYDTANPDHMKNIQTLIEMGADDWNRLQSQCMTFPLREDHMNDFFCIEGMSTGTKRCIRDGIASDGRYIDTAKCDNCGRWERSHAAVLVRKQFNPLRRPTQQEIGRNIVFWCTVIPFIGWGFLFAIANRWNSSNDLMAGFTLGVIHEFGEEEIEAADYYSKCVVGGLFLLFVALLIFTIVIVIQS